MIRITNLGNVIYLQLLIVVSYNLDLGQTVIFESQCGQLILPE